MKSPILLGRAVLPGLRYRLFGRIVQIDSGLPTARRLGEGIRHRQERSDRARELAPAGITVNAVSPGFVPVERHANVSDAPVGRYVAFVPVGWLGTRKDIAHAVSFLASEAAGFVTGQRLVVDGGRGLG